MKDIHAVVRRPVVTEKSTDLKATRNQIVFEVDKRANKVEIKNAIEKLFKVKVTDVRTMQIMGKRKRMGRKMGKRPDWKKALVTLRAGDIIDFFEGA